MESAQHTNKKRDREGSKLFILGVAFFAIGAFFSYGIVLFFGAGMMIAGILPPSGNNDDPI
jgi:membrane-bound ClpP family serine protease